MIRNDGDLTIDTAISEAYLTKSGDGKLHLEHSYTGTVNVAAGNLRLGSGSTIIGNVSVSSGGTFGGGGPVNGKITVEGGGSTYLGDAQIMTATSAKYMAGSTAEYSVVTSDISTHPPLAGTDYDQINLTGSGTVLQIDSGPTNLQLDFTTASFEAFENSVQSKLDDLYFIFHLGSATSTGEFTDMTVINGAHKFTADIVNGVATFSQLGLEFDVSYQGNELTDSMMGGNDLVFEAMSVPEPNIRIFMAAGICLLVWYRRSWISRAEDSVS